MKDYEKEIENIFLDLEDDVLDKLKKTYEQSLKDVQKKAKELQDEIDKLIQDIDPDDEIKISQIRSKVYQLQYQRNLEKQIDKYFEVMKDENVNDINDYLNKVYSNGFLTEQYRLMNNGLDITMPINQKLLTKAVTFKTEDIPLSTRLYTNVDKAKRDIISEISRGLSIGMSNTDMARNLKNTMGVSTRKACQIAQNEGARVRQSAIIDSMHEAKKKGADIVKQWSATLDGKTRPVHQELDGKYAEIDEDFKYSGGKVFAPKQFGIPSEDINCRCTLLTVPRWDMEDTHWQMDNETKELVNVKNYQDWKQRIYLPREIEKATDELIDIAKKVEPIITKDVTSVVTKNGGEMSGLDFRLKGKESLKRKITTDVLVEGKSLDEVKNSIYDTVRYTAVIGSDYLVKSYNGIVYNLNGKRYNLVRVKNTFKKGNSYKGINCVVETPDGFKFELQFHTKQSLEIKEINHKLYEEWRLDSTTLERKDELAIEMMKNADKIIHPKNVDEIESFNKLKRS